MNELLNFVIEIPILERLFPMIFKEEGIAICVNDEHPLKAEFPIEVTKFQRKKFFIFMAERFSALLNKAKEISKNTIATNSQATYSEYINIYEQAMVHLKTDHYEINLDKMMVFIQFSKDKGYTYNTLKCRISAFSYYFRSYNLPNLTQNVEFTNFHKGVLRDMKLSKKPNRKLPWDPQFFDSYLDLFPIMPIYRYIIFILYVTFLLRISENIRA